MIKLKLLLVFITLCYSLPVKENKEEAKNKETKNEQHDEDWEINVEYGRYLKEVVQALESDPEFRKKLENADVEDIKSGKIARELHLVDHNVRTKLDELKRRELERLRHLAVKEHEKKTGVDRTKLKIPVHLDHRNPERFESEDLRKLILQLNKDLEIVDQKRQEEFKRYEMEKEYDYKHKLEGLDEEQKKQVVKEHEEQIKKHKEHPKLHHPGSKNQFEEVWEEQDHMNKEEFDPSTFFYLHDLDGNGYWDENEVKALFQKELDKMYDPNAPEDDLNERYEEMERMRQHVFSETDTNKDMLINLQEFLEQTKKSEFERDEGWEGLDEQELYSQQEYEEFERQRQMEIQRLIDSGAIPPPPGYHGLNVPQHLVMEDPAHGRVGVPPAAYPSVGGGPNLMPQSYQQVPQGQVYQQLPQGQIYQQPGQGHAYQQVPQGQVYQQVPQGQVYQQVPQGQAYQQVPQGQIYQQVPQGQAYQQAQQGQAYQQAQQGQAYQQAQQGQAYQQAQQGQAYQQAQQGQAYQQAQQGQAYQQAPQGQQVPQGQAYQQRPQGQANQQVPNSPPNNLPKAEVVVESIQPQAQVQGSKPQAVPQAQAVQSPSHKQELVKKAPDDQGQVPDQPPGVILQNPQDTLNHHPDMQPLPDNRIH